MNCNLTKDFISWMNSRWPKNVLEAWPRSMRTWRDDAWSKDPKEMFSIWAHAKGVVLVRSHEAESMRRKAVMGYRDGSRPRQKNLCIRCKVSYPGTGKAEYMGIDRCGGIVMLLVLGPSFGHAAMNASRCCHGRSCSVHGVLRWCSSFLVGCRDLTWNK